VLELSECRHDAASEILAIVSGWEHRKWSRDLVLIGMTSASLTLNGLVGENPTEMAAVA
jgi:hypothetical protein